MYSSIVLFLSICCIWLLAGALCYLLKVNGAKDWKSGIREFTVHFIKVISRIVRLLWSGLKIILPFLGRAVYEEVSHSPYPDSIINSGLFLTNEEALALVAELDKHPYDTPSLSSYLPEYGGAMWIDVSAVGLISKYHDLPKEKIGAIIEKVIQNYFMKSRNTQVRIYFLVVTATRLYFAIPLSKDGQRNLDKQTMRTELSVPTSEVAREPLTETVKTIFSDSFDTGKASGIIRLGYLLSDYEEYGVKVPLSITMPKRTCNILIAGKSGSGKSFSARWYLYQMACGKGSRVFVADYKGGEEYEMLEGSHSYASGKDAIQMVEAFYEFFTGVRNRRLKLPSMYILFIEEWMGLLTYAETLDKKLKASLMAKVGEILSVGRGLNLGVVLTVQRADASLFSNGSREQFQCVLSFGRCSKEQFSMLGFSGEMEENPTAGYKPGQALALIDGQNEIQEILVPRVNNATEMSQAIRSRLDAQPDIRKLLRAKAGGGSTGQ